MLCGVALLGATLEADTASDEAVALKDQAGVAAAKDGGEDEVGVFGRDVDGLPDPSAHIAARQREGRAGNQTCSEP